MARAAVSVTLLGAIACGPKVQIETSPFDEDLDRPRRAQVPAEAAPGPSANHLADQGPFTRSALLAHLDQGPGALLAALDLQAVVHNDQFVGWRVRSVDPSHPAARALAVDDVVTSVNGMAIGKPDEFMALWTALRNASTLDIALLRQQHPLTLRYPIAADASAAAAPANEHAPTAKTPNPGAAVQ